MKDARTSIVLGQTVACLLVTQCLNSKAGEAPKQIDWSHFPSTPTEADVEYIISEISSDKVAAVSLFHGGRVEVYTKDYRYLTGSSSDPQILNNLQDRIRSQGRKLMLEQE